MKIIHSNSKSPFFNLAAEEFLFTKKEEDVLFLYVNAPSVIIGSNQAIRNEVNIIFCIDNNISIVRRLSGGGTVYHDSGNLNFCFITKKTPQKSALSPDFLLPVVEVLHAMHIPVEIGKRKDLWLPGGFKVSGTASHINKNKELHHGTLLYDTDLHQLRNALTVKEKDLTAKGIPSVPSEVKNIKSFLNENQLPVYSTERFIQEIEQLFCKYYHTPEVSTFSDADCFEIHSIEQTKYNSEEWLHKI